MSKKTIINIKSLTINLNGETISRGFGIPSGLIAALVSGFASQPDAEVGTSGEASVETTAPAEASTGNEAAPAADAAAEVTPDDVLRFLTSDTRYDLRTADSIRKHFGDRADEAMDLVDSLVTHGMVGTKRQRGSGLTLYRALATPAAVVAEASEAAALDAVTPELDETSVRTFLASDERYSQRTFIAIAKHFNADHDAVRNLLESMADNGDVSTKTRRSDGATLYSLA